MADSALSIDGTTETDFKVGEWWVRPLLNELEKGQATVRIEARSLQVLICLARHAPRVTSRERIIQEVWGEDAFITDEALSHAIWELRRVFDDDAREPRYIQTIPRKGYRLVAEVARPSGVAEPRLGARVDQYRIDEELGSGAMGVVYKATDCQLKRIVALKFVAPELTRDETARRRFEREARLAAALDHPNLGTVHHIGETVGGQPYIVTAFYGGGSLKDRLERGRLELEEAVKLARQLADGLSEAHRHDVIHRDVKPANVLLTENGDAKLVDFGIAKLAGGTRLTTTGKSLGTPAYKSPEQSRGNQVDHRSDIWSLGVVLYEMVGGRKPFRGDFEHAIVRSILEDEPEEPTDSGGNPIPEALAGIVRKALAKDPEKRYQTAADLSSDLARLSRDGGEMSMEAFSRPRKPSRWLVVALVLAVLGSFWVLVELRPDTDKTVIDKTVIDKTAVEIERFLKESRRAEIDGLLEDAEAHYEQALEVNPENSRVLAHLALLKMRLPVGDQGWAPIRDLVDRALADPSEGQAWVAEAELLLKEDKPEEAEKAARTAIERTPGDDPDADRAQSVLGEVLIARGRIEEGLETIRRAEELGQEGYIRSKLVLAYYLRKLGRQSEAAAEYEDVLRYRDRHGPSLNNLGVFYLEMGRFDDALPKLSQAFDLKPTARRANNVGTAYFYLGKWQEAAEYFEKAIRLDPEYPNAYAGLGDAREASGRSQDSVRLWEQAVDKYERELASNERIERRAQMAVYLAKLHREEEAREEITKALEQEPDHIEINFSAAQVYALLGDRERVYSAARRAAAGMFSLTLLRIDPCFKELQDDPRFQAVLEGRNP